MALVEADRVIAEAFKGINSKYIKIKNTPIQKVDTNITIKNKDYDMRQVRVECSDKKIGLMASDITAGIYCPYCGRIFK